MFKPNPENVTSKNHDENVKKLGDLYSQIQDLDDLTRPVKFQKANRKHKPKNIKILYPAMIEQVGYGSYEQAHVILQENNSKIIVQN